MSANSMLATPLSRKVLGMAAFAIVLAACSTAPKESASNEAAPPANDTVLKPEATRKAAPPFEWKDANGDVAKLADYKGKVVLLNFWATWCSPCKAEMPWFEEFDKKFKDKGFAVLGVS